MILDPTQLGGWRRDPGAVARALDDMTHPRFAAAAPRLSRSGLGKATLLYKAFRQVNGGRFPDYPAQTIGDCVSHGFGHGIDLLEAVQIVLGGKPDTFKPTATEAIYAMARVEVGGLRGSIVDGAVGAWAAKAVSTLGTLTREDVGPYDGLRARRWGALGIPPELRAGAALHRVVTTSLVTTYGELEDALSNGYPVAVCSPQGFTLERDADGFCDPCGGWLHCMLIVGARDLPRPGACVYQSWGNDVPSGPLALDQPPNSFWADRRVVERMLAANDSWSLSRFEGYPAQTLPDHWTYDGFA